MSNRVYETPAVGKLDEYGIDQVCESIVLCESMTTIAQKVGVSIGTLINWLNNDNERSARAREARAQSARMWDQMALDRIDAATDVFTLAQAREAAQHLRWRASKIAPKEYGDKQELQITGELVHMTDDQRRARLAELEAKLAIGHSKLINPTDK